VLPLLRPDVNVGCNLPVQREKGLAHPDMARHMQKMIAIRVGEGDRRQVLTPPNGLPETRRMALAGKAQMGL